MVIKLKVMSLVLGIGLLCFIAGSGQAKATSITSYGTKMGVFWNYYSWTGTTYGNWCDVIMYSYDLNTNARLGLEAAKESDNGWAQTPTTYTGIDTYCKGYHYTVNDTKYSTS